MIFICISPNYSWGFASFHVYWNVDMLFKVIIVHAFCLFSYWVVLFFLFIGVLGVSPMVKCSCCKYLLPFRSLHFHSLNCISWFTEQKLFILMQSNFSAFSFMGSFFCLRRLCLPEVWRYFPLLLSGDFMFSHSD